MISRKEYLSNLDQWAGSKEEIELVKFCVEYIQDERNSIPEYKEWKDKLYWNNLPEINQKTWLMLLSKKVLEVYNGQYRKKLLKGSNQRS